MYLWHASPKELDIISAKSYWALNEPEEAWLFGLKNGKNSKGAWLNRYEVSYKTLDEDFSYSGVIDKDLGGDTEMYRNKKDTAPDSKRWVPYSPVIVRNSVYYRPLEQEGSSSLLTHRRLKKDLFCSSHVVLFSAEERNNSHYGPHVWTLLTDLPEVPLYVIEFAADYYDIGLEEAEELVDPPNIVDSAGAWDDEEFVYAVWDKFEDPGYRTYDGAVVLDKDAVEMSYKREKKQ